MEIPYVGDTWEPSKMKRTVMLEVEVSTDWASILLQISILTNWCCLLSGDTVLACIHERVLLLIDYRYDQVMNNGNFLVVAITRKIQDIPVIPFS